MKQRRDFHLGHAFVLTGVDYGQRNGLTALQLFRSGS